MKIARNYRPGLTRFRGANPAARARRATRPEPADVLIRKSQVRSGVLSQTWLALLRHLADRTRLIGAADPPWHRSLRRMNGDYQVNVSFTQWQFPEMMPAGTAVRGAGGRREQLGDGRWMGWKHGSGSWMAAARS